jgi:hypothetical protein
MLRSLTVALALVSFLSFALLVRYELSRHHDPPRPAYEAEARRHNIQVMGPFIALPLALASVLLCLDSLSRANLARMQP